MIDAFIEDETGQLTDDFINLIQSVVQKTAELESFTNHSEVNLLIVDNEEIKKLNWEYRKIDRATDVLSFPMEDFEEDGILGDIVISIEQAREQSGEYGHPLERELGFLTAHGMLHLFGYDHETPEQDEEMTNKQEAILTSLSLHRG